MVSKSVSQQTHWAFKSEWESPLFSRFGPHFIRLWAVSNDGGDAPCNSWVILNFHHWSRLPFRVVYQTRIEEWRCQTLVWLFLAEGSSLNSIVNPIVLYPHFLIYPLWSPMNSTCQNAMGMSILIHTTRYHRMIGCPSKPAQRCFCPPGCCSILTVLVPPPRVKVSTGEPHRYRCPFAGRWCFIAAMGLCRARSQCLILVCAYDFRFCSHLDRFSERALSWWSTVTVLD